jgi:hypothetical protein
MVLRPQGYHQSRVAVQRNVTNWEIKDCNLVFPNDVLKSVAAAANAIKRISLGTADTQAGDTLRNTNSALQLNHQVIYKREAVRSYRQRAAPLR